MITNTLVSIANVQKIHGCYISSRSLLSKSETAVHLGLYDGAKEKSSFLSYHCLCRKGNITISKTKFSNGHLFSRWPFFVFITPQI